MSLMRDILYGFIVVVGAPVWMIRLLISGKWRSDWAGRFGRCALAPAPDGVRTLLLHAVSVGEVNAIRLLVDTLANRHADRLRLVISATTNTGIARAQALYGQEHAVVRYPLDFSWAVGRFFKTIAPDAIGLVELEVWPNFMAAANRRSIPVAVINGRLSERSFGRYKHIRFLVGKAFSWLNFVSVQDASYGERFVGMGVDQAHVHVDGTMKWDTAQIAAEIHGAQALAKAMGIDPAKPLIVCGSTGPGEERMLGEALGSVDAQVMMVPRKPERFGEAASALEKPVRRTHHADGEARAVDDQKWFLLDTMGELTKAYALADLVIVGRSFCRLYGSDMMEPVAMGRPTVVGPQTGDFAQTMKLLLDGQGIVQVASIDEVARAVKPLLKTDEGRALAERGQAVIRAQQGATVRIADRIDTLLS